MLILVPVLWWVRSGIGTTEWMGKNLALYVYESVREKSGYVWPSYKPTENDLDANIIGRLVVKICTI